MPATPQLQKVKSIKEIVESYKRLKKVTTRAEELAEELAEEEREREREEE